MSVGLAWSGMSAEADDRLAIRCRAGDAAAFDAIVERYQARLFRFAFRLLQDRSEAEDAVQETFVRTFRALPGYRPDGCFSSWIYRIALNECRRRLRRRRPSVPLDPGVYACDGPDPQQGALTGERDRQLYEALAALPEHYRLVVVLFYFEGFSTEQAGRALGISVGAVKVRLHRARERLATRLAGLL